MKNYVIDFICSHANAETIKTLDSCLIGYDLVADWHPTKEEAISFIKKYFSDIAEFKERYRIDTFYDPFVTPQDFMVEIVTEYIIKIVDEKFSRENLKKNILTN